MRRLTLGPEDKQVRDWFRKACEAAGLEVHVDALGTMFGLRKGRDMTKPPVGLGSHLDTQPTGGKFDGVLGTLAALEVVRTLNDAGIETETPICIVNWTNEEGSRFAPAMMASAAYVGDYHHRRYSVAQGCRRRHGWRGARRHRLSRRRARSAQRNFRAFVELHIEQGPMLEAEGKTIGVVDSGQGIPWYDGRITGFESHAGTTPMPLRTDALAALAEFVLAIETRCKSTWPERGRHRWRSRDRDALAQRDPRRNRLHRRLSAARWPRSLAALDTDLQAAIAEIAARRKVAMTLDRIWQQAADHFNPKLVDAVENATKSSATAIAASPPAPAMTPATSTIWFRPR